MPNFKFDHNNFTILDLDRSLKFYEEALGLTEFARLETPSYIFAYLGDAYRSDHVLELQVIKNRKTPFTVGDNLAHLAFMVDDFEAAYERHKKMNCIIKEHKLARLYWIQDPDGYLIEIVPKNWGQGFRY
jgi:lactoylglutathione lyase